MVKVDEYISGFPEKIIQENMLKADQIRYYSQAHSFPWVSVARRTCGITAAAMAISYFRSDVEPLDVLKRASELHKVPAGEKNYWLTVETKGEEFNIPVGKEPDQTLLAALEQEKLSLTENGEGSSEYQPVFSLAKGYDHRGSKRLFESFGIKAEMLGDKNKPVDPETLKGKIRGGAMFMASVTNSITPWMDFAGGGPDTHILLITDIVEISGKEHYHVVDPYSPSALKAVFYQPVEGFHGIEFNGFGTLIYTK